MIRLEADPRPSSTWLEARQRCQPGPHLGDPWIAYRVARGLRPAYLIAVTDSGQAAAVGVAYESRPRFRPWIRSRWSLDRTPWRLPETEVADAEIVSGLVDWTRSRKAARLELMSFDGPALDMDLGNGFQQTLRFEFDWDLTPEEEVRWSGLKASHRRKVRKAEKAGVTCADETSPDRVELLRELQDSTRSRRQERGEEMDLPDAGQYRDLARTLVAQDGARLLVARLEERPLSCLLMGVLGPRAYYLMGGTCAEGLQLNSASLLMWRASALLREQGVERLNLGGVPAQSEQQDAVEHGLYRFKEGFGARRFLCRSGALELT